MHLQTNNQMKQSLKQTIAILFGGCSSEYSVSLSSAHAVIQNLDKQKYMPIPIGISQNGQWYYFMGILTNCLQILGAIWKTAHQPLFHQINHNMVCFY